MINNKTPEVLICGRFRLLFIFLAKIVLLGKFKVYEHKRLLNPKVYESF